MANVKHTTNNDEILTTNCKRVSTALRRFATFLNDYDRYYNEMLNNINSATDNNTTTFTDDRYNTVTMTLTVNDNNDNYTLTIKHTHNPPKTIWCICTPDGTIKDFDNRKNLFEYAYKNNLYGDFDIIWIEEKELKDERFDYYETVDYENLDLYKIRTMLEFDICDMKITTDTNNEESDTNETTDSANETTDSANETTDSANETTDSANDTTESDTTNDNTKENETNTKANKTTKNDINLKYSIIYNTIAKLEKLFETVDKYERCFNWRCIHGNISAREYKEKKDTIDNFEWYDNGDKYTAEFTVTYTKNNVYAKGIYTKNGKQTTLTTIKNSYNRLLQAVQRE